MPVTSGQRLLFLSPRVPHPLNNGAKIRTNALLTALRREYAVDYVGFLQHDLSESEARAALAECRSAILVPERSGSAGSKLGLIARGMFHRWPVTILKYWHPELAAAVRRWLAENPNGIIHADHIHMAPYLELGQSRLSVIDEHNVEAQILERAAKHYKASGLAGRMLSPAIQAGIAMQARRMRRSEAEMIGHAGLTTAVSEGDAEQLRAMAPGKRVEVVPNGVDAEYFAPPAVEDRNRRQLIFTGSMNWLPNEDALIYFAGKILPLLRAEGNHPPWRLDIVGQNPSPAVRALASETVRVTGTVDDVRPYVHGAETFVVPLRIGGGSRLKILEAFAMGIPVVSTTVGCEGLGTTDGQELLIADDPPAFVEQLLRLEKDPQLRQDLTARARKFILEHYTWGAIGGKMLAIYR